MNRLFFLIMAFAVWAGLFAETVVKNSAPFAFPTTVGTMVDRQLLAGDASFRGKAVYTGRSVIVFSWSLPASAEKGVISIFRIDGSRIASLAITSSRGSVHWGISGKTQAANGIYLATLSYGTIKRDCKVVLYK